MTQVPIQTGPSQRPSSVDIANLDPSLLSPEGWQRFSDLIAPAVARQTEVTMFQLLEKAANREAQLWVVVDEDGNECGGMVTRISVYPSGIRTCLIWMASTLDTDVAWESMRGVMREIERFAIANDCDSIRIEGRRGWGRLFPEFDPLYVTFEKRLRGVH